MKRSTPSTPESLVTAPLCGSSTNKFLSLSNASFRPPGRQCRSLVWSPDTATLRCGSSFATAVITSSNSDRGSAPAVVVGASAGSRVWASH